MDFEAPEMDTWQHPALAGNRHQAAPENCMCKSLNTWNFFFKSYTFYLQGEERQW